MIYHKRFMICWGLSLFLCNLSSRRQLDYQLNTDGPEVLNNVNRLAGTAKSSRPVNRTLDYLLGKTGAAPVADLRTRMARRLIRTKALDAARLQGRFLILIDASGYLVFRLRHCDHCLTQRHGETTLYMHQVLEAKLLGPAGMVFSIASEMIDNRDTAGAPAGAGAERIKQDCELKAMRRLMAKLRAESRLGRARRPSLPRPGPARMANSSGLPRALVPRGGPIYDGKVDGRAANVAADPARRALLVSVMTSGDSILSPSRSASGPPAPPRLGSLDVLALSVWCGLAGGLLEVGARVIRKTFFSPDWFCWMSRHFVWLIPLTDLIVFAVLGVLLAVAATLWPRRGRWIAPRLIVVLTVLPVLIVLIPGIYPSAWFLVALGAAARLAPVLERNAARCRRGMLATSPALVAAVVLLAGWRLGGPWLAERREAARPMPAGDPPNVILITLDTVRADHLSLHGYERPTSPILEVLARSGIRFDAARAASPWTLPSHATLFTGAWPHQLGVAWNRPLDETYPTLAGLLGSRGYATAAFVANTHYCSYETGLLRGFAHSEDYVLPYLLPFRTSWLFDRAVGDLTSLGEYLGQAFDVGPLRPLYDSWLTPYTLDEWRKDAGSINRAFLDWLGRRPQPARPFFAFLNYYDAHSPYVLPTAAGYRFGLAPRRASDFLFLTSQWTSVNRLTLRPAYRKLAEDSYDNCIAFLDEQVGVLVRELGRSGVLDHTWLIVTADHGEGMGEHGLFDHGESLYAQEIHVPLVIVPPAGRRAARNVREPVSLRDLPATILDVVGLAGRSSFPGRSLAPLWRDRASGSNPTAETGPVLSELPSPSPGDPNRGRSPARKGPLVAIAEGDFVYIRNMGDRAEELYNEREDPGETRDLGHDPASRPTLERLRSALERETARDH